MKTSDYRVEQKLWILPKHLNSPLFWWVCYMINVKLIYTHYLMDSCCFFPVLLKLCIILCPLKTLSLPLSFLNLWLWLVTKYLLTYTQVIIYKAEQKINNKMLRQEPILWTLTPYKRDTRYSITKHHLNIKPSIFLNN